MNLCLQGWRPAIEDRPMNPAAFEGKCPPNDPSRYMNPPICGVDYGKGKWNQSVDPLAYNDMAQLRALGFDLVRLGISWSLVEPSPGEYSESYIDRIAQIVQWAKEQDIRVIIDFHEDFYSFSLNNGSKIGSYVDGAPPWAVLNDTIKNYPDYKKVIFDDVGFNWETC